MTQPNINYERIAAKFQQRLAETVARYEADLAIQADNYEQQIEALAARVQEAEAANVAVPEKD